jgi:putative intracellular protease/amidase
MLFAILLYPKVTALDAVGPYDVFSKVPGDEVVFVGERTGPVRTEIGSLGLIADATLDEITSPDVVVVPGGHGQADLMSDGPIHDWLRHTDATTTWTTSVCSGSLLLAAAGLLRGRRATSHWLALDQLPAFGAEPTGERVVRDGKYLTAAGVSSGIDMALTLVGLQSGDWVAQAVQLGIEYDPQPPYDAGSPDKAPADVVGYLREKRRFVLTGRD